MKVVILHAHNFTYYTKTITYCYEFKLG